MKLLQHYAYVIAMYTTVNLMLFRPNRTSSACDRTKGVGTMSRLTHASDKTLITYTVRAHQSRKKMGKKSTSAVEKTMPEMKTERLLTFRNFPTLKPGRID